MRKATFAINSAAERREENPFYKTSSEDDKTSFGTLPVRIEDIVEKKCVISKPCSYFLKVVSVVGSIGFVTMISTTAIWFFYDTVKTELMKGLMVSGTIAGSLLTFGAINSVAFCVINKHTYKGS